MTENEELKDAVKDERKVAEGTATSELLNKLEQELKSLEEDSVALATIYLKEIKKRLKDLNI
jgi:maleate cis-trans isomerase